MEVVIGDECRRQELNGKRKEEGGGGGGGGGERVPDVTMAVNPG